MNFRKKDYIVSFLITFICPILFIMPSASIFSQILVIAFIAALNSAIIGTITNLIFSNRFVNINFRKKDYIIAFFVPFIYLIINLMNPMSFSSILAIVFACLFFSAIFGTISNLIFQNKKAA